MATCPECDSDIDIDEGDVDVGDELSCSECGASLRVSSDSPVELEATDDDDEDDDDFDDDDDEDGDDEDEDEEGGDDWNDTDNEE